MNFQLIHGDLLDQDVDVIVNAWNRNIIPWWLLLPQDVSGAIKKSGGFNQERAQAIMLDELQKSESPADVTVVVYRRA